MSPVRKSSFIGFIGALTLASVIVYMNAPRASLVDVPPATAFGPPLNSSLFAPNLTVVIHESTLNDLVSAIGPLTGEKQLLFKSGLTNVKWKIDQARGQITDSGAVIGAVVSVRGIGLEFDSFVWSFGGHRWGPPSLMLTTTRLAPLP
jgi:hypothetical protein